MKKSVVVVGGGTGTHTVLRGLKKYTADIDLAAIVSMADSGGSTGRLRDEFGQLPAGDIRNALTALASDSDEHDLLLRQLFAYRFTKGEGLAGHNFGNIFLTVLTDILGSEVAAIEAASRILRVAGRVVPVTTEDTHLCAEYESGEVVLYEHDIDELKNEQLAGSRITKLSLEPRAVINPQAAKLLEEAEMVILGPGDLYTSVLANVVVEGFSEALQNSKAKVVYVCNLMSKRGQTVGMQAAQHLAEISRYTKVVPDFMFVNSQPLPGELIEKYQASGDHPIVNNCAQSESVVLEIPLIAEEEVITTNGDKLIRSLIRHDSDKLAKALFGLLN